MIVAAVIFAALLGASESVSCTSCEQNNAYDCTGPTCQGEYCLSEQWSENGVSHIKRSCSRSSVYIYPDQSTTQTLNSCEKKTINGITWAVELCDSASFCGDQCNSVSSSSVFAILFIPAIILLKF